MQQILMSFSEFQLEVEKQHQHLHNLGEMMAQMSPTLQKDDSLIPVFLSIYDSFLSFLRAHADFEEKVMRANAYPQLERHHSDHEARLTTFHGFRPYMVRGMRGDIEEVRAKFSKYLDDHIQIHDTEMLEYLSVKMK